MAVPVHMYVSINYVVFMDDFSVRILGRWIPKEDHQKC
jgi:hypothetical protein